MNKRWGMESGSLHIAFQLRPVSAHFHNKMLKKKTKHSKLQKKCFKSS